MLLLTTRALPNTYGTLLQSYTPTLTEQLKNN